MILDGIKSFAFGVIPILGLYIIYYYLRLFCFRFIRYYLFFIGIYLIYRLIQNLLLLNFEIINSIILIVIFIMLIKCIYIEDKKRLKLYKTLKTSQVIPILVNGFTYVEDNEIDFFNYHLNILLGAKEKIYHKMFSFISYNEHIIEVGIVFLDSSDSISFLEDKQLEHMEIEENEFIGNGASLKFTIKSLYIENDYNVDA